MIVFIYTVLIFLVLRFCVTLFNFLSNPKLARSIIHYDDKVSVLIPVRNESRNILNLLLSVQKQDYKNIEVLILDDASEDDTYSVCENFCETDSRFTVVKGKPLARGWLGKNFACHQLGQLAIGKYMLFLDADEEIRVGLINSLIFRLRSNRLALLSIFANQKMLHFGEKLTVPLMHFLLLNLLPLRLVRLSRNPAFAAASGQCMFFDAEVYRNHNWHEKVKNRVVEDLEITKLIKQNKYNAEVLLSNESVYCRMYQNLNEAVNGFSKNVLAGFNYNIPVLLLYLLLVIIGPLVLIFNFNITLLILPLSLIILSRIMISFLSGQNVWLNIILHPLQMLMFFIIAVISIKNHIYKSNIWKGRTIKVV